MESCVHIYHRPSLANGLVSHFVSYDLCEYLNTYINPGQGIYWHGLTAICIYMCVYI